MCWKIATNSATLVLVLAVSVFSQNAKALWSRAIFVEPANGSGPGWFLTGVEQQEEHLVGIFGYGKAVEQDKSPAPLVVEGTESDNGAFWPNVSLEIRDTVSGKWKRVEGQSNRRKANKIIIAPGEMKFYLLVNFDPFKTMLDRFKEGQVTFDNGDKISFSLDYLRADK